MIMTKRRIRVISGALAFLALLIFCGMPFQQAARAEVIVSSAVIAIIIAALAAMGITFTMTGGYQTVEGWIREKIDQSGIDFSGVKYGANSVGELLLNNLFVKRIAALAMYIKLELGLIDNATHQIYTPDAAVLDQISGRYFFPGTYTDRTHWTIGTTFFSVPVNGTDNFNVQQMYMFNDIYYRIHHWRQSQTQVRWTLESSADGVTFTQIASGSSSNERNINLEMSLLDYNGTIYFYLAATSYATYSLVQPLVAVQSNESLDAVTGTIAIPDDATIGTQGGILSLPVPWGQSMGQTLTEIPGLVLDDELAGNTSLELEDAQTVQDQVSDTATAEQPYVGTSASEYQSPGLTDVFPFCIPFDLYDLASCLAADPEAPVISWRFYVPEICDETITLDLSRFDTVASVVRTMELLLFIVGLAMVTRDKFLRG